MDRKVLGIFLCVQAFLLITAVNSDKGEGQPQQEKTQGRYWRLGANSPLASMPESYHYQRVFTSSPLAGKEGHRSGIYRIVNTPIPLIARQPGPESDEMQPQSETPN
ncbi:uncharacterized protein LOC144085945 isoform X1 [Stigmatopora argus]